MLINPYLTFKGNCAAAFEFYAQHLGGKIVALHTFGDSPMAKHVPPEHHKKLMHARLVAGANVLMGSDSTPEHPYEGIKGCSISLNVKDPAEAERIFAALSQGGKVQMPIQKTFWAQRFGMFTDQFGVPWLINCE